MRRDKLSVLVSVLILPTASAQWTETSKLLPADVREADEFGASLSLEGALLVIGAPHDNTSPGDNTGTVRVFERLGGAWSQIAILTASDAERHAYLGGSVSMSGGSILAGAEGDAQLGVDAGAAYIFERVDGAWSQVTKLTAPDGAEGDRFGTSVALDGDIAVVGAEADDDLGDESGSAHVFVRSGGVWSYAAKLTAPAGASLDRFGHAVAASGGTIVVSTPWVDHLTGAAYVFENQAGQWTHAATLVPSVHAFGDRFGFDVAIEGDRMAIGAIGARYHHGSESGAAYIFERVGGVWLEAGRVVGSGPGGDSFGVAVALRGPLLVVGAPMTDYLGAASGSAEVFALIDDEWTHAGLLTAHDGAEHDEFGGAVAAGEGVAMVGVRYDDDHGNRSGSAYVFESIELCSADFNGDGRADTRDVVAFLSAWVAQDPSADFDGNGRITTRDVTEFLNAWVLGC
ncbi:MAG TPA: FG-GAP repeat protein [Phycisphaerales bacterium]|nr:FG-GAP repeat protein [Phycisphaerales bacterium]